MIKLKHKGNFKKITYRFENLNKLRYRINLEHFGEEGVLLLKKNTPKDTGKTANSWYYTITKNQNGYSINFHNSNIQKGVPIAIILQYGHGTKNGGWVEGVDYINPSIEPVFNELAQRAWKEVIK